MKVSQLIEKLKEMPQEARVMGYNGDEEAYQGNFSPEVCGIDTLPYAKGDKPELEEGEEIVLI